MPLDTSDLRLGEWFCDNPACPNHVWMVREYKDLKPTRFVNARVMIGRDFCEVGRHTYVSTKNEEFQFCDWCKGAIDKALGRYDE